MNKIWHVVKDGKQEGTLNSYWQSFFSLFFLPLRNCFRFAWKVSERRISWMGTRDSFLASSGQLSFAFRFKTSKLKSTKPTNRPKRNRLKKPFYYGAKGVLPDTAMFTLVISRAVGAREWASMPLFTSIVRTWSIMRHWSLTLILIIWTMLLKLRIESLAYRNYWTRRI